MRNARQMLLRQVAAVAILLCCSAHGLAGIVLNPIAGTGSFALVPNGSFETGDTTGWSDIGFGPPFFLGRFQASSDFAFLGQYSARAEPQSNFNGPGFAAISGPLSVIPEERYVLSGFFNTSSLTSGLLYLDLNDLLDDDGVEIHDEPLPGTGWHFAWIEFTPHVSTVQVRMVRDGNVRLDEFGYIDGVALTLAAQFAAPTSEVAVPAPSGFLVWLVSLVLVFVRKPREAKRLQ